MEGTQHNPCISAEREHKTAPVYLHRRNTRQPLHIGTDGTQESPCISAQTEHKTTPACRHRRNTTQPLFIRTEGTLASVHLRRGNTRQPTYIYTRGNTRQPLDTCTRWNTRWPLDIYTRRNTGQALDTYNTGSLRQSWKAIYLSYPYIRSQVVTPGTTMASMQRKKSNALRLPCNDCYRTQSNTTYSVLI